MAQVRSTVVATFVAPLAGATMLMAGVAPHLFCVTVKVCTGVDAVSVESHAACATTNQKFAPRAVVSKLVCVTEPTSGGGFTAPGETWEMDAPADGCHCRCTGAPFTSCAPSAGAMTSNAPAPQPAAVVNEKIGEVERAAVGQKRSDFATTAQKYVVFGSRFAGVNCVSSRSVAAVRTGGLTVSSSTS